MNRKSVVLIFAVVGLLGALAGMWVARQQATPPSLSQGTLLPDSRALPDFALLDQHGAAFGREQLRGRWTLVFFGFTHCPDVCPSTLAALAAVRRQLADLPMDDLPAVVMFSVDPARDTPEKLAPYLGHFDPAFTGATGPGESMSALTQALGIAVHAAAPDIDGNYSVDHTAAVLLLDRSAALRAVFSAPHDPARISADFRAILDHVE